MVTWGKQRKNLDWSSCEIIFASDAFSLCIMLLVLRMISLNHPSSFIESACVLCANEHLSWLVHMWRSTTISVKRKSAVMAHCPQRIGLHSISKLSLPIFSYAVDPLQRRCHEISTAFHELAKCTKSVTSRHFLYESMHTGIYSDKVA